MLFVLNSVLIHRPDYRLRSLLSMNVTVRPTLDSMTQRRLAPSLGLVTDPLLTALSLDFDPAWGLAPHPGGLGL